jgi:nicotinamide-nucleotide amidase
MSSASQPMGVTELEEAARQLAQRLAETRTRLVLAESCTGGLVTATLTRMPGISQWFCGSAVTYRDRTKVDWLNVSAAHIAHVTAVSEEVAGEMAMGVLQRTPEADLAVSVTGHLGPDAPASLDGVVWFGVARRHAGRIDSPRTVRQTLSSRLRVDRQCEAAAIVMRMAMESLGSGVSDFRL